LYDITYTRTYYKLQQIINYFCRWRLPNLGTRWARQKFQYSLLDCTQICDYWSLGLVKFSLLLISTTPWRRSGKLKLHLYIFLTWLIEVGGWSDSRPGRFSGGRIVFGTSWNGDWEGLRIRLWKNFLCTETTINQIHQEIRNLTVWLMYAFILRLIRDACIFSSVRVR